MITIKPQKNVRAASVYFDGHLSKDDYYTKGGPDKGKWFGKLAGELGLTGPVKKTSTSWPRDMIHELEPN